MGICVWSPRLDDLGNSDRGIEFCKQLVNRYNFHIYDRLWKPDKVVKLAVAGSECSIYYWVIPPSR